MDALWNDDFHHSAVVALTGTKRGLLHRLSRHSAGARLRGRSGAICIRGNATAGRSSGAARLPVGIPPAGFVNFVQNHDQIANSGLGLRLHYLTSPGNYRAITALMLLAPGTPMLFQGQEFASSNRFFYFADHQPELAAAVRRGRADFLSQFRSLATSEMQQLLADPADRQTFERCKLDLTERESHAEVYALHCDLLRLRKEDAAFSVQHAGAFDGAVLGSEAFLIRFFNEKKGDRLLLVNLGADLHLQTAPEPLLAPPEKQRWEILWSSEHSRYGGSGTAAVETDEGWRIPGHAAVVLLPQPLGLPAEAI